MDDFNDTSIKITINPGEIKAKISVFIIDDDLLESVELFDVEISIGSTDSAGAELSQPGIVPITVLNEDSMSHLHLHKTQWWIFKRGFYLIPTYRVALL